MPPESAEEQGAAADTIARKAIFKSDQLGGKKAGVCKTPREFFNELTHKSNRLAFDMEEVAVDDHQGIYLFHHCALCEAWRELGCTLRNQSPL